MMVYLKVDRPIVAAARRRPLARKRSDYPRVSVEHLDVAERLASPLLMGPPLCDELIALVEHLVDQREAAVMRRLRPFRPRSPAAVAKAERIAEAEAAEILSRLADQRGTIVSVGPPARPKYMLMPIVPGIFEMTLIRADPNQLSPWHQRFAELFEALYETGYLIDYFNPTAAPLVRYLPVGEANLDVHPMALPTDMLEAELDRFEHFAVGPCQCRLASRVVGRDCGKPIDNCLVMGNWALEASRRGIVRAVSHNEALAIKREAEEYGLVNWMMNVGATKSQSSCSCCGCCCHALRTVIDFNVPAFFAPPRFLPRCRDEQCTGCGRCARICPMNAITIEPRPPQYNPTALSDSSARPAGFAWIHRAERCVGCGLCAVHCRPAKVISMEPAARVKPYRSWFSLALHAAPGMVRGLWQAWRRRP